VEIERCTKADFDYIREHIVEFWGSERTLPLHHPLFLYEFGDTAYVIRDGDRVVAYLFGLYSQTESVAYVQFIGVHETARRQGLAGRLYERFESDARAHGCAELKAITTPDNRRSMAFHQSIGTKLVGPEPGVDVTPDYGGPGQDRVVMRKNLRA
jgi:L-amino acid N-acyltransferase YncA